MNNALIAIGGTMVGLREQALLAAREIGPVEVDHGMTGCKTPDASEYIDKMAQRTAKRTRVTGARMSGDAPLGKRDSVSDGLVVMRVEFFDASTGIEPYWLEIEAGKGELCLTHPGVAETLAVRPDARTLTEVLLGRATSARRSRRARSRSQDRRIWRTRRRAGFGSITSWRWSES